MSKAAIATSHLSRLFASVRAVDDLALEVPPGIVFGFLGPNGSGKTTTIRLLLGLIQPTAGTATVLGFDAVRDAAAIRARSGALLEHTGLYERLSAAENLEYYARIARMPGGERAARIRELLQHIDLWDRRNEPIREWSRGMKQKLAVARALLHRPPLVFLDEPTSGLDPVAAAALRDDLASLARRDGITVFLTTHNLGEAERLCQKVAVVRRGRLLAAGTPGELRERARPNSIVTFSGRGFNAAVVAALRARPEVLWVSADNGHVQVQMRGAGDASLLVAAAVAAGAAVEEVKRERASLEDLFLDLVADSAGKTTVDGEPEVLPC